MNHKYKVIFKIAFIALLISSCKHKSLIDEKISEYISKNAHNPDSYEPVSTTAIDTVTEIEYVREKIKDKLSSIHTDSTDVERNSSTLKTDSSSVALHQEIQDRHRKEKGNIYGAIDSLELASAINDVGFWIKQLATSQDRLQKDKDELRKFEFHLDSIQKNSNPNNIYRYHFLHQFRGRVPLGGMMLKNAFVETDKDYNILSFDEQ